MPCTFLWLIRASTIAVLALCYFSVQHVYENLSPQGCKMSRMIPSYVVQTAFNTSWTPLGDRYTLSLYREVGLDPIQPRGLPVLFIPGNAGSSHQVRSIASSATRQYYKEPLAVAPEFSDRNIKSLDFYAVDFNEDLSAFHGPTLDSQIKYTSSAILFILSLYPKNATIIIMGHSMGGVVATSLLPSPDISAIITMSTPHALPPARFDWRINKIYQYNQKMLELDHTPILSLCGGATDMMIPSESCVLPMEGMEPGFRRTVFTSALEGAWTGVGHREMVWCHQVRWRVARAALELGTVSSLKEKGRILDEWIRDGHALPATATKPPPTVIEPSAIRLLDLDERLQILFPRQSGMYLMPLPLSSKIPLRANVLVGFGSIVPYTARSLHPLRVSVLLCSKTAEGQKCSDLPPDVVRLVPRSVPGQTFPMPEVGADESEGVIVFEGVIPDAEAGVEIRWLGIRIEGGVGEGWIYAGFAEEDQVVSEASTFSLLFKDVMVPFKAANMMRIRYSFPHIKLSGLLVYKFTSILPENPAWCSDPLMAPLLVHESQPTETHYFPLHAIDRRILLHTHTPSPYIPSTSASPFRDLAFVIYSSGALGCNMDGFTISIDWPATLGRWASRYFTTLLTWSIGVVAIIIFNSWGVNDGGGAMPSVTVSLQTYSGGTFKHLLLLSIIIALLPFPARYYLGTSGDVLFAPLAPLLLLCASGLVSLSWLLLQCLLWPLGKLAAFTGGRRRRRENVGLYKSTVLSMALVLLLIFLFVPWQVAYLGCWLIHLFTCASSAQNILRISDSRDDRAGAIPLLRISGTEDNGSELHRGEQARLRQGNLQIQRDNHAHAMHLLLLMTWLLPVVAPVLAVWVRTLATAGLTTPFDGDHDVWNIAPFLVLVDFASRHSGPVFKKNEMIEKNLSVRWCWAIVALTAAFIGPTRAYKALDAVNIAVTVVIVARVGQRYWGGSV